MCEIGINRKKSLNSPSQNNLWRRQWHLTPVLLPRKSHGRRSLVGCSPWGRQESDRTERLHFHFSLSCIGEGNGNPLQCSCLENPRDGGAWWAAVSGVTRSRTRLKRLGLRYMERGRNKVQKIKVKVLERERKFSAFTAFQVVCFLTLQQ